MALGPILCTAASYVIASAWESWAHRELLHANSRRNNAWRRCGFVGLLLRRVRFNHHVVHHTLMHSTSWSKERIASRVSNESQSRLEKTQFGETIQVSFEAITLFSGVPLVMIIPLYAYFAPIWTLLGVMIALTPFLITKYIHPYLHAPFRPSEIGSGRTFTQRICYPVLTYIRRYHAIHHLSPTVNFNLMLGADYLFRTARCPPGRFSMSGIPSTGSCNREPRQLMKRTSTRCVSRRRSTVR